MLSENYSIAFWFRNSVELLDGCLCTNEKVRESYVHNQTIDHRLSHSCWLFKFQVECGLRLGCFEFRMKALNLSIFLPTAK